MEHIISIDAETNGLWGDAFSIAAVKYDLNGKEVSRFLGRCPINGQIDSWVGVNVLPEMEDINETHDTYEDMLRDFSAWWLEHKENSNALWHMGHIVETHVFREMHKHGFIGDWDAPYVPIELSEILRECGHQADSVDKYIEKQNLQKPEVIGGTHNPLYDSIAAATVYFDLKGKSIQ